MLAKIADYGEGSVPPAMYSKGMGQQKNVYSGEVAIHMKKEMLKEECQSLQSQQDCTNTQLETVKNELKEESRLRMYVQKEGQEFKEQAIKAREDIAALQDRFLSDSNAQNSILMEARDMHAAAMTQCEALQDEILRLREEHSQELRELAERAGKEADYNLGLMNKMDNTLHEHDHLYMQEINKLHLRLSEEIQEKENVLRELEKHRSLAQTAEQNWLREKDAHEQALRNTAALTSEMQSLQVEVEKLMKQLSRIKKHKDDRRTWEQEVQNARHMAELNDQRLQEIQAELERRKYDQDRKLHEAEAILSKAIQQQFSELKATTGSGTQLLKYSKY